MHPEISSQLPLDPESKPVLSLTQQSVSLSRLRSDPTWEESVQLLNDRERTPWAGQDLPFSLQEAVDRIGDRPGQGQLAAQSPTTPPGG